VLRSGLALGIFPEGHRSKDGKLQPAKMGMALIAFKTGTPILPVGISGTRTFLQWPKILHRPRVIVTVGEPLYPPLVHSPSREQQAELSEEVMRRIAACLPPDQHGLYDLAPEETTDERETSEAPESLVETHPKSD
jgi:1-acyl-sn-glycerol-3-phosphate acyltransferase